MVGNRVTLHRTCVPGQSKGGALKNAKDLLETGLEGQGDPFGCLDPLEGKERERREIHGVLNGAYAVDKATRTVSMKRRQGVEQWVGPTGKEEMQGR